MRLEPALRNAMLAAVPHLHAFAAAADVCEADGAKKDTRLANEIPDAPAILMQIKAG